MEVGIRIASSFSTAPFSSIFKKWEQEFGICVTAEYCQGEVAGVLASDNLSKYVLIREDDFHSNDLYENVLQTALRTEGVHVLTCDSLTAGSYQSQLAIQMQTMYPYKKDDILYSKGLTDVTRVPFNINHYARLACFIIRKSLTPQIANRSKLFAVDCDHTLWDGIVSEGEYVLPFKPIQQQLVKLSESGRLVTLLSRNSAVDVQQELQKPDSVLKVKHIVSLSCVNFDEKTENLSKTIETELGGISLSSVVFIDDNPYEVEKMKRVHPEVISIVITTDNRNQLLEHHWIFDTTDIITEEDRTRTTMIKQELTRNTDRNLSKSLQDFMTSLSLEVSCIQIDSNTVSVYKTELERSQQLLLRSTQFNSNPNFLETVRSGLDKWLFKNNNRRILAFSVSDKYGSYGIVGVVATEKNQNTTTTVHQFVMSCRVLNRGVEHSMIRYIYCNLPSGDQSFIVASESTSSIPPGVTFILNESSRNQLAMNFMTKVNEMKGKKPLKELQWQDTYGGVEDRSKKSKIKSNCKDLVLLSESLLKISCCGDVPPFCEINNEDVECNSDRVIEILSQLSSSDDINNSRSLSDIGIDSVITSKLVSQIQFLLPNNCNKTLASFLSSNPSVGSLSEYLNPLLIENDVINTICKAAGIPRSDINISFRLSELGIDSVRVISLINNIIKCGVSVDVTSLTEEMLVDPTVSKLCEFIKLGKSNNKSDISLLQSESYLESIRSDVGSVLNISVSNIDIDVPLSTIQGLDEMNLPILLSQWDDLPESWTTPLALSLLTLRKIASKLFDVKRNSTEIEAKSIPVRSPLGRKVSKHLKNVIRSVSKVIKSSEKPSEKVAINILTGGDQEMINKISTMYNKQLQINPEVTTLWDVAAAVAMSKDPPENLKEVRKQFYNRENKIIQNASDPTSFLHAAANGNITQLSNLTSVEALQVVDKLGLNLLSWAAGNNQLEIVKKCIEEYHIPVDSISKDGRTALMWCCRNGHLAVADYLVNNGADVTLVNKKGNTCLHWAVWGGQLEVCEWLVKQHNQSIETTNHSGCNGAIWAITSGSLPVCHWILSQNGNFAHLNYWGHGTIVKAAWRGRTDLLKWLLKSYVPAVHLFYFDADGKLPIDLAAERGHTETVNFLRNIMNDNNQTCVPAPSIKQGIGAIEY